MKKKRERRIAMLLAIMMLIMNLIVSPVWAEPGDVVINATNFPDNNFRDYVSKKLDKDNDGKLSDTEIAGTTAINVSSKSISSLSGIEYFTALKILDCHNNKLTTLDVSKNTALETLSCGLNQLTNLDVSKNTALQRLECPENQLISLDVSKNTALQELECSKNQLTSLDISKNTALQELYCDANKLTNLDISKNTALEHLYCSDNQLTNLDTSKNTALKYLYCKINPLSSLDVSKNPALEELECISNQLTNLDVSKNPALTLLNCSVNKLKNLDLSNNPALLELYCSDNQLTSLDISNNPALQELACSQNKLKNLDLSNSPALVSLQCERNNLTSLDVSNKPALKYLYCSDNQLTNLNVSNSPALEELICVENQLTSLDVSNKPVLKLLYCKDNKLTNLDVSNSPALQEIDCSKNQLTSLDVSNRPALQKLYCWENQLTNLDVSKNPALQELECGLNQLTKLDVSNSPALKKLGCGNNQLSTLDISKNTALEYLDCQNNKLTKLDVSKNTELKELYCSDNQLTNLGLSNNPALEHLHCSRNQLTKLDVSNKSALKELLCEGNQLTSLDLSNNTQILNFDGDNQTYDVKVKTSDMKIPYADFPGYIESTQVLNLRGATLEVDGFKVDNVKPTQVTYDYATGLTGKNINVTLNITYDVYTVTFNTNGGTAINPQTITPGEHVTKPTDPTKDGYTFAGWYKDAEFTTAFDFVNETINADTTIYAKWTQNAQASYTLTVNVEGGHGSVTPASKTVNKNETVTLTFTPDTGYEIEEVKVNDVATPVSGNTLTLTMDGDKTVVVKYKATPTPPTPVTYTLKASVDGGHGSVTPTNATKNKDETVTLTFTPETGYEIEEVKVNDVATTVSGNTLTLTMDGDKTVVVKYKSTPTPPPAPTVDSIAVNSTDHKTAYKVGEPLDVTNLTILVTMSDGTTKTENVTADMVSGFDSNTEGSQTLTITYEGKTTSYKVTVTAAPTPPPTPVTYTLTASVDGGHGSVTPTNATKNKNETVTLTFAPETGYEIDEVKVNDVATPVSGNTLTLTMDRDKTVVVKYKAIPTPPIVTPVTITFDKNGGSGTMADVTKNKGEQYPLPACGFIPPAGKEFKAWQVDGTEKNVGDNIVLNGDKIIKAVWKDIGSVPPTPPVPPTPYTPYPWIVYPGWYYNFETPKPKEEKPVTKMEIDWKLELIVGVSTINREINGVQSKIKMDIAPYIRDGRIMLPIRYVAEALGFDVEWIRSTRTVVLKNNSTRVEIPVDTNKIIVNGTVYTSDVKPEIKNNRTMLPIANIARALGLKDGKDIIWNSKSKMVTIYRTIVVK